MKLVLSYSNVSVPFDFSKHHVYSLILENTKDFYNTTKSLINFDEDTSKFLVFQNDNQVKFELICDVLYDYYAMDMNAKRSIVGYLQKSLISHYNSNDFSLELSKIKTALHDFNTKFLNKYDLPISYNQDIDINSIIKLEDYKIIMSQELLENLIQYIEVLIKLNNKKIFIFIGLENYLSAAEMKNFIKQIEYYDVFALFISPFQKNSLNIPTVKIDNDLCELLTGF